MSSRRPRPAPATDWTRPDPRPDRRRPTRRRARFGATGVLATIVALLAVGVTTLGAVVYLHERDTRSDSTRSDSARSGTAPRAHVTARPAPLGVTGAASTPEPSIDAGHPLHAGTPASGTAAGSAAGSRSIPAVGAYSGGLVQTQTTRLSQREYEATMTLGADGGSIDYPTLGCRGVLTAEGHDDETFHFRERITSGDCDQGGRWNVTWTDSRKIHAEYTPVSGRYGVRGTLTR